MLSEARLQRQERRENARIRPRATKTNAALKLIKQPVVRATGDER